MSKVRLFGHSLLWVFTVSITVLAVLLVAARFFLTEVPTYKNVLEEYLSEEIGAEVNITDLSARMSGFRPQLSLTGITLDELNNQTNTLNIGEIRLSFNPLSFVMGTIKPSQITIVNTSIKVKRFADGHLSIVGLSSAKRDESSSVDFSWLLDGGRYEVIDSQIIWQDDMRDLPDITLDKADILFQNNEQEHALKVTAKLPKETGGSFVLSIKLTGDVLSTTDWHAKGYFKAKEINIAKHLTRLKIDKLSIDQGEGDIELWSTWDAAKLSQVKGYVLVRKASLLQGVNELNVSDFSGDFAWQKVLNGWSLKAQDFTFKTTDTAQQKSQFSVHYKSEKEGDLAINVAADGVNLKAISNIVQYSNSLDESSLSVLEEIKFNGLLNNASASINRKGDSVERAACGVLKSFSSRSYKSFPEVNNFSGTGCSTQNAGWSELDINNGSVHFKTLFRDPIIIDKLSGQLTWNYGENGWLINSDQINLNSPHIATQTRVKVQLPDGDESPSIDLQTNFGQANSRFTSLYLPVGIMGKEVVKWLDAAFIEGEIKEGGLLLKGPLSSFPYRQNKGVFQVLFGAQGVRLHYADKWPDVIGASADVEFKNEGMNIYGRQGLISSNEIDHALVNIVDFKTDEYLHLSGKVEGDIKGLYRFFKHSPLNEHVSTLLNHSIVTGPSIVNLNLEIPLRKKLKPKVRATAHLKENTLIIPSVGITVNDIQGDVEYDEQGLSGESIKGYFLGEKLDVDIMAEKNNTVIVGKGQLNVASIAKEYPSSFWKYIGGSSAANIKIELPHSGLTTGGSSMITLTSGLKGISVDLPAPVGKQRSVTKAFEMSVKLGQKSLPIKASYGDELKTYVQMTENADKKLTFEKADIHFGKTDARLPASLGVQLSGTVGVLNIAEWKKVLGTEATSTTNHSVINQLNLKIQKLDWLDTTFDDVHVTGEYKNSMWLGEVNSPNILGRYEIPNSLASGNKISLDLEELKLPSNEGHAYSGKKSPVNPSDIPSVDINSKEFFIGASKLGKLKLELRKKDSGIFIKTLSLKSARDDFKASGAWEVNNGQNVTGLNGSLRSKSLGSLLKDTNITRKLKDAPVDIYFDLNWPGEPQDFSKEHLSGYVQVKSDQGRLLDVEPGIGRVFGLLSLSTLQRRLQLDFSDLVQKGLSFDKIKGRFNLLNGEVTTNRFYLESPSSRLDFQGKVSLANEELDQLITVTPKTTESLPLAGAIAGGPLLGAAVFIVQKIAGKTVNQLVGYQYRVNGAWSDPKIKQISQPGGKIFGMMDNVLTPVFDATLGQLPFSGDEGISK